MYEAKIIRKLFEEETDERRKSEWNYFVWREKQVSTVAAVLGVFLGPCINWNDATGELISSNAVLEGTRQTFLIIW